MTVLRLPYYAAADLAQTIAIACRRLEDEDGKLCPIEAPRREDYLVAALRVIDEMARVGDPEMMVVLVPPDRPTRCSPLRLDSMDDPLVQELMGATGAPSPPSDPSNGANGPTGLVQKCPGCAGTGYVQSGLAPGMGPVIVTCKICGGKGS